MLNQSFRRDEVGGGRTSPRFPFGQQALLVSSQAKKMSRSIAAHLKRLQPRAASPLLPSPLSASPSPPLSPSSPGSLSSDSLSSSSSPSPSSPSSPALSPPAVEDNWAGSWASLVRRVQLQLPFLLSSSTAAAPQSSASSSSSSSSSSAAGKRRRARSAEEGSHASASAAGGSDVVIDVKRRRLSQQRSSGNGSSSGRRQKAVMQLERGGSSRSLVPLSSVVIDRSHFPPARPPPPLVPASFPPLLRLASAPPPAAASASAWEEEAERNVWSCLAAVERAIDREVDTLLSAHDLDWRGRDESLGFRSLVLRVMEADQADRRLRRLCTVEPQWAVYALQTLTNINHGREGDDERRRQTVSSGGRDSGLQRPQARQQQQERLSFRVRRRSQTSCDLLLPHDGTAAVRRQPQQQPQRQHRRALSTGAQPLTVASYPITFSVFVSSASGLSYPLRPPPPAAARSPSSPPPARSAFLLPFLRTPSSLHALLLSVFYLSLLHTSDAAAVRKSHFAAAVVRSPAYVQHRRSMQAALQQQQQPASAHCRETRLKGSRERLWTREVCFLIDSCCLTLVQADVLPQLPWTAFDAASVPDLPIASSLGLR